MRTLLVVIIALLILILPSVGWAASSDKCAAILGDASAPRGEATPSLTAYLGQLLEERVIDDAALARVLNSLESGRMSRDRLIEDVIPQEKALEDSAAAIQREGLEKLLEGADIDRDKLREWVEETIKGRSSVRERRGEASQETIVPFQRVVFNRVEPCKFEMGEKGKTVPVTISKPFEMAAHQFTQWQWAMVLGDDPWYFKDGANSATVVINGKAMRMQPDNPAEQINYDDVTQRLIPKLNQMSLEDDPLIYKIIEDHEKGAQYRLPTEAEWEFVARDRGRANGEYHFGDDESELGKYAWTKENSNNSTHPVGEKLALFVDGKPFYDLHGNIWEWVQNVYSPEPRKGHSPVKLKDEYRVLRGGSWDTNAWNARSADRGGHLRSNGYSNIGFRLVRIVR